MLISTLEELKKYIPSTIVTDFGVMENFLSTAERKEIQPVLGQELYAELVVNYSSSDPEDKYINILPYVQRALANFAYYNAVPILDVTHTNAGFAVHQTSSMAPASANRVKAFRKGVQKLAYDAIEALLQFLEENKDDYPSWVESSFYSDHYSHLLYSAREFQKYVNIEDSRYVFLRILPKMREIEDFEVKSAISEELFDELIEEINGSGDLSDEKTALIQLLKPAIANLTMAGSIDILSTAAYAENLKDSYEMGDSADERAEKVNPLRESFKNTGTAYLMKARGYILANLDKFETYKSSDLYDEEVTSVEPYYDNEEDSHIASFGGIG